MILNHEAAHLVGNLFDGARVHTARYQGDGAEAAEAVAPFGNLYIGEVRTCGELPLPWPRLVFGGGFSGDILEQGGPVEFAVPAVHLGQLGGQLLAVALGQAAHHRQLADLPGLLGLETFENHIDRLLLGITDKSARVDHHLGGVRLFRVVTNLKSRVAEHAQKALAVDEVLRAAHRDNVKRIGTRAVFGLLSHSFTSKSDLTNSCLSNTCRSSIFSPRPM